MGNTGNKDTLKTIWNCWQTVLWIKNVVQPPEPTLRNPFMWFGTISELDFFPTWEPSSFLIALIALETQSVVCYWEYFRSVLLYHKVSNLVRAFWLAAQSFLHQCLVSLFVVMGSSLRLSFWQMASCRVQNLIKKLEMAGRIQKYLCKHRLLARV